MGVDDLLNEEGDRDAASRPRQTLGKLAELLERSGISVEDVARVNRVNAWQGFYKDQDGEAHHVDMVGIQLVPEWADGPSWPVVQPATPIVVRHRKVAPLNTPGVRRTVLLPDPQIGFLRLESGELIPTHDRQALDVALAVIDIVRPHVIGNMGDTLDLAEMSSKFLVLPEFVLTTQPAVDETHRWLGEQQAAAGPELEEHWLLEGNHDDRLPRMIAKNAMAALRLRRADAPKSWPVLSVPNLLALDKLGIEYVDGYPAGRKRVADGHGRQTSLYALHGERLDMKKQAKEERVSTVQGHAHHVALHSETYDHYDGTSSEVEAWSIGCLCDVDGAVPSVHGGVGVDGRPKVRHESWQQAVAVVTESEDGWSMEIVRIRQGVAVFRGKTIRAAVEVAG